MASNVETQGIVKVVRHESTVLKGHAVGDPYVRDLCVYLPPGYEESDTNLRLFTFFQALRHADFPHSMTIRSNRTFANEWID